jgi:hypothetical protein
VTNVVAAILHTPVTDKFHHAKKYIANRISNFLKESDSFRALINCFRKFLYCNCLKILLTTATKLTYFDNFSAGAQYVSDLCKVCVATLKIAEHGSRQLVKSEFEPMKKIGKFLEYVSQNVGCDKFDKMALFIEDKIFGKYNERKKREDTFIDNGILYLFTFCDTDKTTPLKDGVSIMFDLFPQYMKFLLGSTALGLVTIGCSVIWPYVTLTNAGLLLLLTTGSFLAHKFELFEKITKIIESRNVTPAEQTAKKIVRKIVQSTRENPMLFPGQEGGDYELSILGDANFIVPLMKKFERDIVIYTGTSSKIEIDLIGLVDILQLPVNNEIINILKNANNKNIQDVMRDIIIAGNVSSKNNLDSDPEIETLNGGALYKTIIDPSTHAKYSTDSREGKRLLKNLSRVIMNTVIIDPHTGKSHCVYSKEGMKVLESYMIDI